MFDLERDYPAFREQAEMFGLNSIVWIAGYPKSGNTWLGLMIAEALACPHVLFWDKLSEATITRSKSDCLVVKSHEDPELHARLLRPPDRIVYIIRDPRDVVVSGAAYFFKDLFNNQAAAALDLMIEWVRGGDSPHPYLRTAHWQRAGWNAHVAKALDARSPVVRYEDLLERPVATVQRVLTDMRLQASEQKIAEIAAAHSFVTARERFRAEGNQLLTNLMREGRPGAFRRHLSRTQVAQVEGSCREAMGRCGYEPDEQSAGGIDAVVELQKSLAYVSELENYRDDLARENRRLETELQMSIAYGTELERFRDIQRAEIQRLQAELGKSTAYVTELERFRDIQRAEIERLQMEFGKSAAYMAELEEFRDAQRVEIARLRTELDRSASYIAALVEYRDQLKTDLALTKVGDHTR